jgi:hypothetical protein
MNTGHDGSMTTIHANGPREAIVRLEGMALLAGIPLPAARAQVAAAIDLVVALDRDRAGRRRVAGLLAVTPGAAGAEVGRCGRAPDRQVGHATSRTLTARSTSCGSLVAPGRR